MLLHVGLPIPSRHLSETGGLNIPSAALNHGACIIRSYTTGKNVLTNSRF
ncbi:MAG: hypothetical protein LBG96_15655 [Tannerella sp.]|jgi:hypothetical protein|nr:hypothetical protein [Tannerella sp.]